MHRPPTRPCGSHDHTNRAAAHHHLGDGLNQPLVTVVGRAFSGRDLILLVGGLFLIGRSTLEIHERIEGVPDSNVPGDQTSSVTGAIVQIMLLDVVFSLDSVITAVGMAREVAVMVAAIVIAVGVMLVFAGTIIPRSRCWRSHSCCSSA